MVLLLHFILLINVHCDLNITRDIVYLIKKRNLLRRNQRNHIGLSLWTHLVLATFLNTFILFTLTKITFRTQLFLFLNFLFSFLFIFLLLFPSKWKPETKEESFFFLNVTNSNYGKNHLIVAPLFPSLSLIQVDK